MKTSTSETSSQEKGHLRVQDVDNEARSSNWFCLLNFLIWNDLPVLITALSLSIASGIIVPTLALFTGKIFDVFTKFASRSIDGSQLMTQINNYEVALVGLALASGILNAAFFSSWITFGELQARRAREHSFKTLLTKDMAWFDSEKTGAHGLSVRMQTQV